MNFTEFLVVVGLSGAALLILTILVAMLFPRTRGDAAGVALMVSLGLIAGPFFVHAAVEEFSKPDEPQHSSPYGEPRDDYGGCSGGVRGC
jgi:hypothetical protein